MLKPTTGVNPGQVNLNEVGVDRHLPGRTHLLLQTAENLHTGVTLNPVSGDYWQGDKSKIFS